MNRKHAYRAHRIDIVLLETARGRYRWIVFIDGEHMSVGPKALTSRADARDDAIRLAHTTIDTLESNRSAAISRARRQRTGQPAGKQQASGALRTGAA